MSTPLSLAEAKDLIRVCETGRLYEVHALYEAARARRLRVSGRLTRHDHGKTYILTYVREGTVKIAKVFKSGNSQAVRIPREFQLKSDEVEIRRRGDVLILRPKSHPWVSLVERR